MPKTAKGPDAPEASEKVKTHFEWDLNAGRLSAKFTDGTAHSVVMAWWPKLDADLRAGMSYGCQQLVSDPVAGIKGADKIVAMRERMDAIAEGEFKPGAMVMRDVYAACVAQGWAKTAEEAKQKLKAKTPEEREAFLKAPAVLDAYKLLRELRSIEQRKKSLKVTEAPTL